MKQPAASILFLIYSPGSSLHSALTPFKLLHFPTLSKLNEWNIQCYLEAGVGIGREATLYILEQGVKVVGTDAWSWDPPFKYTCERFAEHGDPSIIWEGHKAGRDMAYG